MSFSTLPTTPQWINGGSSGCDASKHAAIMDQLTGLFEGEYANIVERYNWFTTYASDPLAFGSGALNVPNWETSHAMGCSNRKHLANAKPGCGCSWGIESVLECEALARDEPLCAHPLVLNFDNDNCYCATDACETFVSTWGGMRAFRELSLQALNASSLSTSGEQYNNLGATTGTSSPTGSPTANPSNAPSRSPTHFPTSPPTETLPMVVKFLCQKNDPAGQGVDICASGEPSLGSDCLEEGVSCSKGGKVCWLKECSASGPGPTPTDPPVSGPTPPSDCADQGKSCTDMPCCTGECPGGKPSGRVCPPA